MAELGPEERSGSDGGRCAGYMTQYGGRGVIFPISTRIVCQWKFVKVLDGELGGRASKTVASNVRVNPDFFRIMGKFADLIDFVKVVRGDLPRT